MGAHETRTFKSGNSVALRLPKSLGIGPDERMVIEQEGDLLTLRRLNDPAEEKRKLLALVEALRRLPAPGEIEEREPIEFPDRPGLY
ncbi:MAG: antitoxin VapB [Sphingomonadales bacterium]|jgi:antitoxin VapB|nr:antitoxin VapB [Sphingomonadales bacterium]